LKDYPKAQTYVWAFLFAETTNTSIYSLKTKGLVAVHNLFGTPVLWRTI